MDMGNNLIPECQESVFVGFFILVDMDRGYFQGVIPDCADFIVGDAFVVLFDVYHKHM